MGRGDQRGQAWPLVLTLLLGLILLALPIIATGYAEGTLWLTQQAADAAALAGAQHTVTEQQTDAAGTVFCQSVAVDPIAGPAAALRYWDANLAAMPSLQTVSFLAVPDGNTLSVQAKVNLPGGGLALVGDQTLTWQVAAEAQTAAPASGLPAC